MSDPSTPPPRRSATLLATGALVGAALPVVLLVADLVPIFTETYEDVDLPGFTTPGRTERLAQAVTTTAWSPALLTSVLGLAVLAALVVAGRRVPLALRLLGAVAGLAVVALAVVAAVGTAAGAGSGFGTGLGLDPSSAVQDAPTVGPLLAVTVFAVLTVVALLGRTRAS
ncbi:hypothetical protein AB2L27_04235 [Kineococcus sp. LSe6-4]|uniref:Uncharacterized protein n=1 Tax=Kineococcus halophytocola TaxID=3234027 RepID=A0ABV4GZE0_9ACTN